MRYGRPHEDLNPADVPGLTQLKTETVRDLVGAGRVVRIPKGWTAIRADEASDKAYLLLEGCVEVVVGDQALAVVGRGEFVGEMGIVNRRLRSARVTATEPVRAVAWPRSIFQELRDRHEDFDALVTDLARQRGHRNRQRH